MTTTTKKEAPRTFLARIQSVQEHLNAPKSKYNKFGKYYYRSCEDILMGAKPLLAENGMVLTITDDIIEIGGRIYVKACARLTDTESGECYETTAYARECETKSGMDSAQITGAASSYARKYALNGLFCIDDTRDPDTMDNSKEGAQNAPNNGNALDMVLAQVDAAKTREEAVAIYNAHPEFQADQRFLNLLKSKFAKK